MYDTPETSSISELQTFLNIVTEYACADDMGAQLGTHRLLALSALHETLVNVLVTVEFACVCFGFW